VTSRACSVCSNTEDNQSHFQKEMMFGWREEFEYIKRYGINWVNWDAPRHLYLHTVKSMELLAAGAGMEISNIAYDSSGQQISSSELYIRGVPYVEHGKYRPDSRPGNSTNAFSPQEWDGFQQQAAELNRKREGDTACFYLRAR